MYACTVFGLFVFFPWGIPQLQSDCGACPVTTDLIMRVNVRTLTRYRLLWQLFYIPGIYF